MHDRCPASMADVDAFMVVRTMFNLEAGHLPLSGGWSEQPGKLMRLADIAARERAKIAEAAAGNGNG